MAEVLGIIAFGTGYFILYAFWTFLLAQGARDGEYGLCIVVVLMMLAEGYCIYLMHFMN